MERKTKISKNKKSRQDRKWQNDLTADYQHCPGNSFLFTTSNVLVHNKSRTRALASSSTTTNTSTSSSDHGNVASRSVHNAIPSSGLKEHDSRKATSRFRIKESTSIETNKISKASKKLKLKKKHLRIKRLRKTEKRKNSMNDTPGKGGKQFVIPPSKESGPVEEDDTSSDVDSFPSRKQTDECTGRPHCSASAQHTPAKANQSGYPGRRGHSHSHQDNRRADTLGRSTGAKREDYQGNSGGSYQHQRSRKGSSHKRKKAGRYASNQEAHWGGNTGGSRSTGWSQHTHPSGFQSSRGGDSSKKVPQSTTTSASLSGASSGASLEIPGFYYDADKKRYFKIQDCGNSIDEDFITKESIAKAKAESQRQKDLQTINERITTKHTISSSTRKNLHKSVNQSVFSLLMNGYQKGEVNTTSLRRAWVLGSASNVRQTGNCHVFAIPEFHQNLEHMIQMELSKDGDKLLCLWSLAGTLVERLQLVTVNENKRNYPGELALDFSSSDTTVLQSWNKITNVCWSDFKQYPDKKYVLYTTRCHTGRTHSLAFIRNLDPSSHDEVRFFDFNLGSQMTWTCSWNFHKQQFGVGTEKGCLVIDVNTRRLWQFKTNKSDALAQIFTKEDGGNTMYTGTRRGSILRHDLRSSSTQPSHLMSHPTSVVCLQLSPEEKCLYASDFSGNIKNWDLRMNKAVLTYKGLFNMQSKLPFHIDETQSLLYGAGQDCYTKIWCLRSGRLLHSIPPPYEASLHRIPAVQFSHRWAGVDGNVGLIMGALRSFYVYGPSSQIDFTD